jgi:hypothetical protein
MMAADHDELPPEVRAEVDRFTEMNVRWLVKVLSLQKPGVAKKAVQRLTLVDLFLDVDTYRAFTLRSESVNQCPSALLLDGP